MIITGYVDIDDKIYYMDLLLGFSDYSTDESINHNKDTLIQLISDRLEEDCPDLILDETSKDKTISDLKELIKNIFKEIGCDL